MRNFIEFFVHNSLIKVLIIFIFLDTVFGILRAIKQRKINSAIGIDGMIRKAGMLLSIFFFEMVDYVMNFNLLFFVPESIKGTFSVIGIGDLFCILFIVFELLSVLKNMVLCKIPIPKKLQKFLNKLLKEFTEEIKDNGGENK